MDLGYAISGLNALAPVNSSTGNNVEQGISLVNSIDKEKDKKPKQVPKPLAPKPFDFGDEMRKSGKTPMAYDNNVPTTEVVKKVAGKMGVNPSLLFSSAWQEGMNKAALKPDEVSNAYIDAKINRDEFPVDGFANYGVDTIGDKYEQLKKYLPPGFEKNFKLYKTTNELNKPVTTAAFRNNESALTAKAAFMRYEMDNVNDYAAKNNIPLDDKARNYLMLARYNTTPENAQRIMDEYAAAPDKDKFISEGLTSLKGVHKNIKPRLDNMRIADELLK